jgi:TrmH family RNA methyltransferase
VNEGSLIARFGRARRDAALAVLEGFHPLKHALRFGASVNEVVCRDVGELDRLAARLAPDQAARMHELARQVDRGAFEQLAPLPPTTGVMALAERPAIDAAAVLAPASAPGGGDRTGDEGRRRPGGGRPGPVVLLEDPRDLGNMGACVRVAAAADAAGVLTTGSHDPWAPDALRGAAGLHFALPVARLERLDDLGAGATEAAGGAGARPRPLLALDPGGEPLRPGELPASAVLAFGTERYGVSEELLARADARVSIPMREGVSSLNLATSVAAVLFAWRLRGGKAASFAD